MILNRSSRLLEPSNPNAPEGGGATPAPAPVAPSVPRTVTPKIGVEPKPKALPEEAKNFQFKIDDSDLLVDGEHDANPVEIPKEKTPLEKADALRKPESVKPEAKPEPVVPELKKEEPKAPDAKKEDAPIAPEIKPIVPKSKSGDEGGKEYDYTGFSQEEVVVLKNMSRQSRDYTANLIRKNKELASQSDGSYLQHPDAYVLDPRFATLNEDVLYAQKEAQHWQEQIIKMNNGEKWQPIIKWDAQGNPVLGEERIPTKLDEINAIQWLNKCVNVAEGKRAELQQFAANYKGRVSQDIMTIQNERSRRFGWVADPKILDSKLVNDVGQEVTVKQVREVLISKFPPYMQKEIGVQVAADLFVAFQILHEKLRDAEAGKSIQQEQHREIARAEPIINSGQQRQVESKKAVNGVVEFSMAGMPV